MPPLRPQIPRSRRSFSPSSSSKVPAAAAGTTPRTKVREAQVASLMTAYGMSPAAAEDYLASQFFEGMTVHISGACSDEEVGEGGERVVGGDSPVYSSTHSSASSVSSEEGALQLDHLCRVRGLSREEADRIARVSAALRRNQKSWLRERERATALGDGSPATSPAGQQSARYPHVYTAMGMTSAATAAARGKEVALGRVVGVGAGNSSNNEDAPYPFSKRSKRLEGEGEHPDVGSTQASNYQSHAKGALMTIRRFGSDEKSAPSSRKGAAGSCAPGISSRQQGRFIDGVGRGEGGGGEGGGGERASIEIKSNSSSFSSSSSSSSSCPSLLSSSSSSSSVSRIDGSNVSIADLSLIAAVQDCFSSSAGALAASTSPPLGRSSSSADQRRNLHLARQSSRGSASHAAPLPDFSGCMKEMGGGSGFEGNTSIIASGGKKSAGNAPTCITMRPNASVTERNVTYPVDAPFPPSGTAPLRQDTIGPSKARFFSSVPEGHVIASPSALYGGGRVPPPAAQRPSLLPTTTMLRSSSDPGAASTCLTSNAPPSLQRSLSSPPSETASTSSLSLVNSSASGSLKRPFYSLTTSSEPASASVPMGHAAIPTGNAPAADSDDDDVLVVDSTSDEDEAAPQQKRMRKYSEEDSED